MALLDAAKPELSEKERIEAKQDIQEAWDRRTILQEYIQDWQKLIEQATQPPKDWQKLMEQAAQPPKDWQKLVEQAAQPPKNWQKLIEQAVQPPVDLTKLNDKPEFK